MTFRDTFDDNTLTFLQERGEAEDWVAVNNRVWVELSCAWERAVKRIGWPQHRRLFGIFR